MRHRLRPLTGEVWQGLPDRVLAPHLFGSSTGMEECSGICMGLFLVFNKGPGSPGMGHAPNYGLSARVNMHVLNYNPLLSAPTKLTQRIHLGSKRLCQTRNRECI